MDVALSPLAQRIRLRMAELGYRTIKELEDKAGVPRDSVRRLLSGKTDTPRTSKLEPLARALDMEVDELVGGTKSKGATGRATVAALAPNAKAPEWVSQEADSMAPTINAGEVVLVDRDALALGAGGVFLVSIGGSEVLRRVSTSVATGKVRVWSDNPAYPPEGEVDAECLKVVGKVLGVFKRL